jgi:hypothetical protein
VQVKYNPIFLIDEIEKFKPSFELPARVDATVDAFIELLFPPDNLLDQWVACTTAYVASKLPPSKTKHVTKRSDIL